MVLDESKESVISKDQEEAVSEVSEVIDVEDGKVVDTDNLNGNIEEPVEGSIEALTKEKDETYERLLRLQAEFDNFKKRTQREKIAERKYRSQELVTELLPVLDNFERALEVEVTDETKNIIEGITMVYGQLKSALKSEDVEVIETVGHEFDPNLHHAVLQVEDADAESNIIIEELQSGYILNERVIRPAMVKVNK